MFYDTETLPQAEPVLPTVEPEPELDTSVPNDETAPQEQSV